MTNAPQRPGRRQASRQAVVAAALRFSKAMGMLLLLLAIILGLSMNARSSFVSVFLAPAATGSGSGADCSNAKAATTFFNSAANWGAGAGQIGPGTVVHVCLGNYVGGVNSTLLTWQGSGTSGSPITLFYESGANMTSAAFGDAMIATNKQWIVIDGAVDGAGVPLGIMQNTANGSALANKIDTAMINLDGSTHVIVRNLKLHNIYVHTGGTAAAEAFGNGIQMNSSTALNDVSIQNVIMDNTWHGILMNYQGASTNVDIGFISCTNCGNGVFTGDRGSGTLTNYRIHDSHFTGGGSFDGGSGANHIEHIHLFGGTNGGNVSGALLYNNIHDGDCGPHCTAFVFLEGDTPGAKVYNSRFKPINNGAQAFLVMKGGTSSDLAYNNVVDCGTTGGSGIQTETGVTTATMINNVIMNCNSAIEDFDGQAIVANNNTFFNNSCISTQHCSMASWQAAGHDAQGQVANPGLNTTTYVPTSTGSAVCNTGSNQTALGIPTLNIDAAGTARPGSGAWDAGAFECGGGATTPGILVAPTSLSFGNQQVGSSSSTQPIVVTSNGTAALSISSIVAAGDYSQTNNCPASLAISSTCTVQVTFSPTATGSRPGTVTITTNAPTSPTSVPLSGTGTSLSISVAPASLAFGNIPFQVTSSALPVTVTNNGTAALTISTIAIPGGQPFALSHNCPLSPSTLAAAASCTIQVTFKPVALGAAVSTLTVTSTAPQSPNIVTLSGNGIATTIISPGTTIGGGSLIKVQ